MSTQSTLAPETIKIRGCRIVLRRVAGPEATELFLRCEPSDGGMDAAQQAEAIYHAILEVLKAEKGDCASEAAYASIVTETLFLRNRRRDLESIRSARRRVLAEAGGVAAAHRPATLEIEQPPLNLGAHLEIAVQAIIPPRSALEVETIEANSACECAECARACGLRVHLGDEERFHALGLYGRGEDAYEQALAMFGAAEDLLRLAGMDFRDVVRTWIHLREMDRDYPALNRARRAFFQSRGIDPSPASTGIGGRLVPEEHDLCLGVYAVKSSTGTAPTAMHTPTLNEAMTYGADFVRGMRAKDVNKVALHVSGTASLDEEGRTAHSGDFEAQADRMLVNVEALLREQGATFGDIVSAVTYLKDASEADRLREKLREAGFSGFPNVLVEARVCRPDLLCETEVLAVLP